MAMVKHHATIRGRKIFKMKSGNEASDSDLSRWPSGTIHRYTWTSCGFESLTCRFFSPSY